VIRIKYSLNRLEVIHNSKGDITKILKNDDDSFDKFGEAYLSEILMNEVKPWKLHKKALLNLIVLSGKVKFVLADFEDTSIINEYILDCEKNLFRLTIPPYIWFSFQGLGGKNLILSISNIRHDNNELLRESLSFIDYDWSIN
jgi:dTDP-4-dehydrorhamnose 3,5-epimerase